MTGGSSVPRPPSCRQFAADDIAVDNEGHRVDLPLPPVTQANFDEYTVRIGQGKLCNDYVLANNCAKVACIYGHVEVQPNVKNTLRSVVRPKLKCIARGECRDKSCYRNHGKAALGEYTIWTNARDAEESQSVEDLVRE